MQLTAPDVLPVLSKGAHGHPRSGACFMEYTALLAGLPFNDHPVCTDPALTRILQRINDRLPNETYRAHLTPLLGRSIGLVAPEERRGELTREVVRSVKRKLPDGQWSFIVLREENIYRLLDVVDRSTPSQLVQLVQLATWLHEAYEEAMEVLGLDKSTWKANRTHEEVRAMLTPPPTRRTAHCDMCAEYTEQLAQKYTISANDIGKLTLASVY